MTDKITMMTPLFSRNDDPQRGRHLIANPRLTSSIPKGRLLFCERPLVALQSLGNPVWVCHACKAFVGGPRAALHILATQTMPNVEEIAKKNDMNDEDEDDYQSSWKVIPCRHNCGQVYCSTECEADFWESRHQFLCTGEIAMPENDNKEPTTNTTNTPTELPKLHPLLQFKQQAVMTNEIFLLVAEWLVGAYTFQKQQQQDAQHISTPIEEDLSTTNPFEDFMMEPWWEIDDADAEASPDDRQTTDTTADILKKLCQDAADLWQAHWNLILLTKESLDAPVKEQASQSSLSPLYLRMANIIGACELNSMGIRRRNPLCRDVLDRNLRLQQKQEILMCMDHAGMLHKGGDDDNDMEDDVAMETHNDEANSNSADQRDEWEYTDDDLARFIAGLDIHEEESANKNDANDKNDNNKDETMAKDITDSGADTDSEEGCCDDDDNNDQDDLDAIFSPLDGTAMYALACKMNHSCDPNVVVLYKTRGWGSKHPLVAHCVALRDIQPGEELTICYIHGDRPLEERQKELQHYGFSCCCEKCKREQKEGDTGPEESQVQESKGADGVEDNDFLFGSDDSDGEGEGEATSENDKSGANEQSDGETALQQRVNQLDSTLNQSVTGSIPLAYLAEVSKFVNQVATQAQTSLQNEEETVHHLLGQCVKAVLARDFVWAKTVGADLERVLFAMLKRESKWPTVAYREAFWCAALTTALALAHSCCFLPAIVYLDKALILGLDRQQVCDFFSYVELHAAQVAIAPYLPAITSVLPSYTEQRMKHHVASTGLVQPIQFPIPEFLESDEAMIHSKHIPQGLPFVIRQFGIDWPAITKWRNLSLFCRYHGHRTVPIEVGAMRSKGGMKEELMTIRAFVAKYLNKSAEKDVWRLQDAVSAQHSHDIAYLAQHPLIQQLPGLGSDINLRPNLCGSLGPSHVYLWIGTGGTRTPLHFDSYSNLFVQLVGVKYVRIYGTDQTSKLYVSKKELYGLQGNMSDVDCEQEDFSLHPNAKDAAYEEVVLFPGDSLFIPARAWHYVRSLSTSMSVNFWF